MTEASRERRIRRILVALDASPTSLAALGETVRLAAELRAELEGLFVEDMDLISFAELPFASVTGALSGGSRRMSEGEVQRSLRSRAARARDAMSHATKTAGIRWSFRVVRGNVYREVMQAAEHADLLSLGWVGASEPRRAGAGSVTHRAAHSAPRSVLLLRRHKRNRGAVVALGHPAEPVAPLLAAAAAAARASAQTLVVLVPFDKAQRDAFMQQARPTLAEFKVEVRWVTLSGDRLDAVLGEALRVARDGLLVIDANYPLLHQEQLARLVDRGGCSLLILR